MQRRRLDPTSVTRMPLGAPRPVLHVVIDAINYCNGTGSGRWKQWTFPTLSVFRTYELFTAGKGCATSAFGKKLTPDRRAVPIYSATLTRPRIQRNR